MSELKKGALIRYASHLPKPREVAFQFNPERLSRTQTGGRDTTQPAENIRFGLLLHASEPENALSPLHVSDGVYPQLAALEELLEDQAKTPFSWLPFNLFGENDYSFLTFRWGRREVPVELERLDIRERMFNGELKPVHVTVELQMRVLTRKEVGNIPAAQALLAHYRQMREEEAGKIT